MKFDWNSISSPVRNEGVTCPPTRCACAFKSESVFSIVNKFCILKFHDMHLLQLGLFMYSHQNRTFPLKFDCKFTLQKGIHSYHTRNSHLNRLPLCRTNIKQFSVFYEGPKFYNSLSSEIVNSSTSVSFKDVRAQNFPRTNFVKTLTAGHRTRFEKNAYHRP